MLPGGQVIRLKDVAQVNDTWVDSPVRTDFNKKMVSKELTKILDDDNRTVLFSDYHELEDKLGGIGASEKTAKLIIKEAKK